MPSPAARTSRNPAASSGCATSPSRCWPAIAAATGTARWPRSSAAARSDDGQALELLYNLYEARIRNYIETPPPEDWNGAFALLTK